MTREEETLKFIKDYALQNQVLPTIQEIANGMYIGKTTAFTRYEKLVASGDIVRIDGSMHYKVKGLRIVRDDHD